ncbi:major tail protein [Arthrobacter phage Ottawa]|nr:major tail protein [Arthrobacter phage Kharcho]WIC89271.1 major tail protein [Arthrobacter phage Ottawa]
MPFRHGKATGVYLDGQNLSPYFNSADVARTVETHDVTAFESEAKSYIAGIQDGTISLSGFFDSNVAGTGAEELLENLRNAGVDFPATIFMDGGVAIGRQCRVATVLNTSYSITSPATDVTSAKADLQADGGVRFGKCLHAKAPITGTITGAAADYGTTDFLTSSGGVANIHPIENTRSTNTEVKIQHSADNSVWVDIATVNIAAGSRAGVIAPTSAVTNLRYVRALITPVAGTGQATIVIGFARL